MRGNLDVLVVGGGSFGSTIASLLAANHKKVKVWVRSDEQAAEINDKHRNSKYLGDSSLNPYLVATTNLEQSVPEAELIMMAIPAQAFRKVARRVGDVISGDQQIVHLSKGIEIASGSRMSEILRQETCTRKIGVLAGPNLAKEIIAGHPSGALIASAYQQVCESVQDLFSGSSLRVYRGDDVIGAEIAGAFKNIIALAAGIVDGLGFKDNTKSMIVTRGFSEMARFGALMGADVLTFGGLAGIGDLMATCQSKLSRNRTVGEYIGKGESWQEVVVSLGSVAEGVATVKAVFHEAQEQGLDLPIVRGLYQLLYEGLSLTQLQDLLMNVPPGTELAKFDLDMGER